MIIAAYHAAESACLAFADPPDDEHDEAVRRCLRFACEVIEPQAYGSSATPRARKEHRRAYRETRRKLCQSYGVIPLFLFLSPLLSVLIQWALGRVFDWLWNHRTSETISVCKAACTC